MKSSTFIYLPVIGVIFLTSSHVLAQSGAESSSMSGELIYQMFITFLMTLVAFYALYKLFTKPDDRAKNAIVMKCPECGNEPFSILKWSGKGIGFKDRMLGFVGCLHCGTLLKRHHQKLMYLGIFIFSIGYSVTFVLLFMLPGDVFIDLFWMFNTIAILMIAAFFLMFFLFLFRTSFYKVGD